MVNIMSTVDEIEIAVSKLSPEEQVRFRHLFFEFDAGEWDKQIERDVDAGRLDQLAEQALKHLQEGRCTPL